MNHREGGINALKMLVFAVAFLMSMLLIFATITYSQSSFPSMNNQNIIPPGLTRNYIFSTPPGPNNYFVTVQLGGGLSPAIRIQLVDDTNCMFGGANSLTCPRFDINTMYYSNGNVQIPLSSGRHYRLNVINEGSLSSGNENVGLTGPYLSSGMTGSVGSESVGSGSVGSGSVGSGSVGSGSVGSGSVGSGSVGSGSTGTHTTPMGGERVLADS